MTIFLKDKHTLLVDDFRFKCCIGKNGISKNKVEGDKKLQLDFLKLKIYIIEMID